MELEPNLYEKIKEYSADGETLFFDGRFSEALTEYNKAFDLIPEPKHRWEASVWLIAAIGDCYFWLRDFATSLEYFRRSPGCVMENVCMKQEMSSLQKNICWLLIQWREENCLKSVMLSIYVLSVIFCKLLQY